jgi:ribosomal protein L37AE/L43A
MGDVEVGRSPGQFGPVDQPADPVALPQQVAEVEVAVQQSVRSRRCPACHKAIARRHSWGRRVQGGTSGWSEPR